MYTTAVYCVRGYRLLVKPLLRQFGIMPSGCRFVPTCSAYGLAAARQYGLRGGSMFLIRRLGRCHPWSRGGYDPLP